MKLPSREYSLPEGLRCPVQEIHRANWQAHLVRHPLGVLTLARGGGREGWNREGWDELVPPVVTGAEREALVKKITGLGQGTLRCRVPEFRGKRGSDPDKVACYDCPPQVAVPCEGILNGGVGPRYAAVTEALLAAVEAGVAVVHTREVVTRALSRLWNAPDRWQQLVLLTVGMDDRQGMHPIVRITRADGVRAEFYLRGRNLYWRTTYRYVARGPAARLSFVMAMARPSVLTGHLSDLAAVPRLWWEGVGRQSNGHRT